MYTDSVIYLFHGTDSAKVRAKAFAWVAAARAKAPDAAYIRLSANELTEQSLNNALSSQGLFFAKTLVLIDDPFADSEAGELVLANLDTFAASANPVALVVPKLLAARTKKLEAVAEKSFKIDAVAKVARGFNGGLVNALAARDGKALWLELKKAERQGDVPEMVHGLLHWKARDLMQKGSRAWTPTEARSLSIQLIELLSDSRGKDVALPLALERFALALK